MAFDEEAGFEIGSLDWMLVYIRGALRGAATFQMIPPHALENIQEALDIYDNAQGNPRMEDAYPYDDGS